MTDFVIGHKFGTLTVLRDSGKRSQSSIIYICRCDCSEIKEVAIRDLKNNRKSHPHCPLTVSNHPLHTIWKGILYRCSDPKSSSYVNYGGRGIYVSEEWKNNFSKFVSDVGPRPSPIHSVERKDNDGPYSKENCVWATPYEQEYNKRRHQTWRGAPVKLTNRDILDVYNSRCLSNIQELADQLKVTTKTIQNIRSLNYSLTATLLCKTQGLSLIDSLKKYRFQTDPK